VRWGQYDYTISHDGHTLTHDFRELRTKVDGARVSRAVGGTGHDCEDDRVWVVADRGAPRVLPPNTLESCHHAVHVQGATALSVDACLTADDELVLWHDWDPDAPSSILHGLGLGRPFRPVVPDVGDPLRRPTVELTLAQLRSGYGYEPGPALVLPTLADLVVRARAWPGFRHLLVDVRVPADGASLHGTRIARAVARALRPEASFDVTLIVEDREVLQVLRDVLEPQASALRVGFGWRRAAPAESSEPPPAGSLATRVPIDPVKYSAVEGAIDHRCEVAIISSSGWSGVSAVAAHDVDRREAFDLNPRENGGWQIAALLVADIHDSVEMELLVEAGASGILTDDVPALLAVLAKTGIR
jgi:glycerophosphoryl diester phosphodiesterase